MLAGRLTLLKYLTLYKWYKQRGFDKNIQTR